MKPYRLLLVGCFTWSENSSCEFFSQELATRFAALPHVTLTTHHCADTDFPEADVALMHAYASYAAAQNVAKLRTRVKKAAYFMEPPRGDLGFDHYYHYDDDRHAEPSRARTFIRIPLAKQYYEVLPKEPRTLLLDHDAQRFPCYGHRHADWNETIWSVLERNRCGFERICQLARGDVQRPSFIETIPVQTHVAYLKATARFQTYLVTHAGSYNHTAVDMAVRGTRVIVPSVATAKGRQRRLFVPPQLAEDLNMISVQTETQLVAALSDHQPGESQLEKATDLDDVVAMMDRDFQAWL